MPKGISLKVRRDPSRKCQWYINVPPALSPTGKRQRLFFETRDAALGECERLRTRRDNFGVSLGNLSSAQVVEAADCYEQLAAHPGLSLSEAIRDYLELLKTRKGSIPFGELFDKFLASKKGKSPAYLAALKWCRTNFGPLADRLVSDIGVRDLEAILETFTPSVRDAFRRYIRAVFNFGVRLDYLRVNPASKLERGNLVKGETEIFTPHQVKAMLDHALEHDLQFLPYRIFAFFCGIRPAGELTRLEWSNVSIADRIVTLPATITKTKRKRFVDLSDNAIAWLLEYQARGGNMTGLVAPFNPTALRNKHRANYHGAHLKKWIPQGARHSFCSYWMAAHGNDVDKLVILSGHQSREVLWRHYYRQASKHEAERFWQILPLEEEQRKIIRLAAS
jgi:integrase